MSRFELAQALAALAVELDHAKNEWPDILKMEGDELQWAMHDLAARLAGHRVAELYNEGDWQ